MKVELGTQNLGAVANPASSMQRSRLKLMLGVLLLLSLASVAVSQDVGSLGRRNLESPVIAAGSSDRVHVAMRQTASPLPPASHPGSDSLKAPIDLYPWYDPDEKDSEDAVSFVASIIPVIGESRLMTQTGIRYWSSAGHRSRITRAWCGPQRLQDGMSGSACAGLPAQRVRPHANSPITVQRIRLAKLAAPTASGIGQTQLSQVALRVGPNPVTNRTRITYSLSCAGPVQLLIRAATGRAVARLDQGICPAGVHAVTWNCRDDRGEVLPSGGYFCTLKSGGREARVRIVLDSQHQAVSRM